MDFNGRVVKAMSVISLGWVFQFIVEQKQKLTENPASVAIFKDDYSSSFSERRVN